MRKILFTLFILILSACTSIDPIQGTRRPAQESGEGALPTAAELADLNRKPSTLESNVQQDLSKLPANVFEAIFGATSSQDRKTALQDFKFQTSKVWTTADAPPTMIFNSGNNMASSLEEIDKNIYVEGFYRNLVFEGNGAPRPSEPYLKWNPAQKNYALISKGAEPLIFQAMLRYGGTFDSTTNLVTLYRGTGQTELADLKQLRTLISSGNTAQAQETAKNLSAKYHSGLFFSNSIATANTYASDGRGGGAVITIQISRDEMANLVNSSDVYAGFEYTYFEFGFLTPEAITAVVKSMVDTP